MRDIIVANFDTLNSGTEKRYALEKSELQQAMTNKDLTPEARVAARFLHHHFNAMKARSTELSFEGLTENSIKETFSSFDGAIIRKDDWYKRSARECDRDELTASIEQLRQSATQRATIRKDKQQ